MRNPAAATIKILIDYPSFPVIACGLKSVLSESFDVQCLGDVHDRWLPETAHIVVSEYREDLSASRRARCDGSSPSRLLVVATEQREQDIKKALQRGITGFVLLSSTVDELLEAVHAVHRGQTYLSPTVARCLAESIARESLTRRESEVLQLLSDGACNKEIAAVLDIAVATVKAHVKAVMEKLEASSRTQAARIATSRGLVENSLPKFSLAQKMPLSLM